jgi:hypothetical protein
MGVRSSIEANLFSRHILIPAVLFFLNLFIVLPLFQGEYTSNMGSIECAYITQAKFVTENFPDLAWYSNWYCGFPFHLSYVPLVPYLTYLIQAVLSLSSLSYAYRILTAVAYALGSVTLYFMIRYLSKRELPGVVGAVIYSLMPSMAFPVSSTFILVPWRLIVMMVYGEGPHILGLTLIPLATVAFMESLKRKAFRYYLATALMISLVALTNLIALFSLAVIMAITLLTEINIKNWRGKLRSTFLSSALAYGLVAFQYDSRYIAYSFDYGVIGSNAPPSAGPLQSIILILVISSIMLLLFCARKSPTPLLWSLMGFSAFLTFVVALVLGVTLVPQPYRYVPEATMFISVLVGLDPFNFVGTIRRAVGRSRRRVRILILFLLTSIFFYSCLTFMAGYPVTRPNENINGTSEYRTAQWLQEAHVEGRIYATGNIAFWLDLFSDVPQIRGGYDSAATNSWWSRVNSEVDGGSDGNLSVLWLKATDAKYVVVTYQNASTTYKDYDYPDKFRDILEMRYYLEGFGVFEIPLKNPGLVQIVNLEESQSLKQIENIADRVNLSSYVDLVEAPVKVNSSYESIGTGNMKIKIDGLAENTALLVKVTYDPAWKAYSGQETLSISKIGPDFMLVDLSHAKSSIVELVYEQPISETVGLIISIVVLLLCASYGSFLWYRNHRKHLD